jgi:hypothetical protein
MKENLSTKFILPMVGKNWKEFSGLINCYIGDTVKGQEYTNNIFVLFNSTTELYNHKINFLTGHNLYVTNYSYDEYEMYVYKIANGLEKDYQIFKQGKYSEFSDVYKNHISRFYANKTSKYTIIKESEYYSTMDCNFIPYQNYIREIINKDNSLYNRYDELFNTSHPRELELCQKPDEEDEVFNNNTLKELLNIKTDSWNY